VGVGVDVGVATTTGSDDAALGVATGLDGTEVGVACGFGDPACVATGAGVGAEVVWTTIGGADCEADGGAGLDFLAGMSSACKCLCNVFCQEAGSSAVYAAATPPDNARTTIAAELPAATRAAERLLGRTGTASRNAATASASPASSASDAGPVNAWKTGSSRKGERSSSR
jgi:hypothetical protein